MKGKNKTSEVSCIAMHNVSMFANFSNSGFELYILYVRYVRRSESKN